MTATIDNDCVDFDPKNVRLLKGSHGVKYDGEVCLVEAACQATIASLQTSALELLDAMIAVGKQEESAS